jgi:Zn-dependent M28 family amino/carboxypeptidase
MTDYKDQIANHIAAIETDSGAAHPTGIDYAGKPELRQWLRPVSGVLDSIGAQSLVASQDVGADIDGLTEKGVPSFSPIQDSRTYFNYHHTAADTFDKVDPRQLAETAAINTVLAFALADSPDPAPR